MMCERVYQDITLPIEIMEKAIEKANDLFDLWPILVYPSKIVYKNEHENDIYTYTSIYSRRGLEWFFFRSRIFQSFYFRYGFFFRFAL